MFVLQDFNVVMRLAAVGHRPEDGIRIIRVDILVDRDDPFAFGLTQ